ncbi:MAG: ABC transporter substrate-binding protein [Thiomicrospira sp.]
MSFLTLTRRKLISASVAAFSIPLLSGCDTFENNDSEVIRMGVTSRPRTLDPRRATDALSSRVNRLIYRQLIDFNQRMDAIVDLADWQALSPTHYRFTLRETSVFHHGKILTAQDVAATYHSVLSADFGSPHRGSFKHIQKIEVINERVIDFWLTRPDSLFVGRLTLGIMPADLIEANHDFAAHPIGSGAARFIDLNEQRLILRRSDGIALHFVVVKDAMVRVLKLQKGEIDCVQNDLSPELAHYCAMQPDLRVHWHNGTSFAYIGFNLDDPWLSQPELRQAIAHAINREEIIQAIFNGQARLAGGLLVPEHWAGNPELQGWNYDLEQARALIEKIKRVNQHSGTIRLSYKTSSDPTRIRLATLYQHQLKQIGIDLQIQSYDWGTFYSDIVKGRFQMFGLAWVGIKSPDIFQYVFASDAIPPNGANRGRYRDTHADALIAQAGALDDLTTQARVYRQLQAYLQQTLPVLPLWYEHQYAVVRHNIEGYQLDSDGRFDSLLHVKKYAY